METLTREQALRVLEEAPVAHLGLISEGKPYVTPMSFVLEGDRVLFRTKPGKKLEAIQANPEVCIEASLFDEATGSWVSVIVRGSARESHDADTEQLVVERLFEKYQASLGSPLSRSGLQPLPGFPHVVEVEIAEVTGMSSGGGLRPRTRPGRL